MKIALFSSDNFIASGAFRAELNLCLDLIKQGHQVTVVLPYHGSGALLLKEAKIPYVNIFSVEWVCHYPINIFSHLNHFFIKPINFFAKIRTKAFLKKGHFDLVAINTAWNGIGGIAAQELKIPLVWHLREILETGQSKRFYNIKKSIDIISKADLLIPVSKAVYKYYIDKLPNEKMYVIYDGVDSDKFYLPSHQLFKDKTTHILLMGRVSREKGQHIAIKALNELSNYDFDVTIVGTCNSLYRSHLLRLGNKIKSRMRFLPPSKDVINFYQDSDIFIMNSIGEAFGLVTAEAMLSGNVVIAAKSDGNIEVVAREENGYFYEPRNVNSLKEQLVHVFNHHDEAIMKARNGREYIDRNFSKLDNSKNIEGVYTEIVKNKKIN